MKKRLNKVDRELLRGFAEKKVELPHEKNLRDVARAELEALTLVEVSKAYPEKDMAIIRKYGPTYKTDYVSISIESMGNTSNRHVDLSGDIEVELPYNKNGNKRWHGALVTRKGDELYISLKRYREKRDTYDNLKRAKLSDYNKLIDSSRYYEEVLAVWPEVEELRSQICTTGTSVILLSEEVRNRIRADVSARKTLKQNSGG